VVARVAHQVSVMYAGEIVEQAPAGELFANPSHPYTRGLLASIPVPGKVERGERLGSIRGTVPHIAPGFAGCAFRDRCDQAVASCAQGAPLQDAGAGHHYLCRLQPRWQDKPT
jgi:oligopeptide/dipeptide ABC transporter ATP-binding protein